MAPSTDDAITVDHCSIDDLEKLASVLRQQSVPLQEAIHFRLFPKFFFELPDGLVNFGKLLRIQVLEVLVNLRFHLA